MIEGREFKDKVRFLMDRIDEKEAEIKNKERVLMGKEAKIKLLTQETDELAKDYFEILDDNVSLGDEVEKFKSVLEEENVKR